MYFNLCSVLRIHLWLTNHYREVPSILRLFMLFLVILRINWLTDIVVDLFFLKVLLIVVSLLGCLHNLIIRILHLALIWWVLIRLTILYLWQWSRTFKKVNNLFWRICILLSCDVNNRRMWPSWKRRYFNIVNYCGNIPILSDGGFVTTLDFKLITKFYQLRVHAW